MHGIPTGWTLCVEPGCLLILAKASCAQPDAGLGTLFWMHIGPHFYRRIGVPLSVCVTDFS